MLEAFQYNVQVTDGKQVITIRHGCEMMSLISAAGCTVTAVIAAFLVSAEEDTALDRMLAASFALGVFGYGQESSNLPYSFPFLV